MNFTAQSNAINAIIKARLLLKNLNPSYPLDLEWLASQLETDKPIIIHEKNSLPNEVSAALYSPHWFDNHHILVNGNHPITKQRFSTMHELSHLYLEHKGHFRLYSETEIYHQEDPLERLEADTFAAEVLMPYDSLKIMIFKCHDIFRLLNWMYHKFFVSLEASVRRVIEVDLFKGAFVLYDKEEIKFTYSSQGFELPIPWGDVFKICDELKKGEKKLLKIEDIEIQATHYRTGKKMLICTEIRGNPQARIAEEWAKYYLKMGTTAK